MAVIGLLRDVPSVGGTPHHTPRRVADLHDVHILDTGDIEHRPGLHIPVHPRQRP